MENKIIRKINELYITNRQKYLLQKTSGNYLTLQVSKKRNDQLEAEKVVFGEPLTTNKKRSVKPLSDWMIQQHLEGNKGTYGVFSGEIFTKFLCFDVDVENKDLAKWITYRTIQALNEMGLHNDYINVSTSGNKGYHVEIFFSNPITNELAYQLYQMVMEKAEFEKEGDEQFSYSCLINGQVVGKVEYRPRHGQGVKLPLGFHQKTKNRCWFVDTNTLTPIENMEYVLTIKQIDDDILHNLFDEINTYEHDEVEKLEQATFHIKENYKPLDIYRKNIDANVTISEAERLLEQGMKYRGTRHNSILKLCKYFKYLGMNENENKSSLIEWMGEQDTRTYSSKWDAILKDIEEVVKYIYDNDVNLTFDKEYVSVSLSEMREIIKAKTKNQMLVLFSMLIHSKRFANKKGVFYMSFPQMETATGLTNKSVRNIVPKLDEQGLVEYVKRNQKQKETFVKKPNQYFLPTLFEIEKENETNTLQVNLNEETCNELFKRTLITLVSKDELKTTLPRRMYDELKVMV